ncbi:MAG TPA: ABC-type transport auxiliary lipoprotein family protein [Tepidisphaeraceae bacterium]|jgi:uncharacterized lipoprotein YmbA
MSHLVITLAAGAACLLATSCGNLAQPQPDKAFFAIDPGAPPAAPRRHGPVLQVSRLRVAAPYNGTAFVYRNKGGEFRSDYYNAFVAPPDQLLTGAVVRWLSAASPFNVVVDASSAVGGRYVLEGTVTDLYGDYTDPAAAKAVIAVHVFLLDEGGEDARIMFQKDYRSAVPIEPGNVNSLVSGWDRALRDILSQMTADLARTADPAKM